jgi:hypothetical protein
MTFWGPQITQRPSSTRSLPQREIVIEIPNIHSLLFDVPTVQMLLRQWEMNDFEASFPKQTSNENFEVVSFLPFFFFFFFFWIDYPY